MSAEPFTCVLPVRWSDQDLNGHVNNARVITLVEELRISAMRSWYEGLPRRQNVALVRAFDVSFEREVHFGPELLGRAWISRIGRTSFTMGHELVQEGQTCVLLDAVLVSVDGSTGRPAPLDDSLREILERQLRPAPQGSSPA